MTVYDPAMTFDEQLIGPCLENAGLSTEDKASIPKVLGSSGPRTIREARPCSRAHQILEPWLESYWILASTIEESPGEEMEPRLLPQGAGECTAAL